MHFCNVKVAPFPFDDASIHRPDAICCSNQSGLKRNDVEAVAIPLVGQSTALIAYPTLYSDLSPYLEADHLDPTFDN